MPTNPKKTGGTVRGSPVQRSRKGARLSPNRATHEALRAILIRQAGVMFSFERKILDDPGPDPVHDMRVAARRLRSVVKIFRKAFEPDGLKEWIAMLSGAIRALGRVRDCDIIIQNLESLRPLLAIDSRALLDELLRHQEVIRDARLAELKMVVREMRSGRAAVRFARFVKSSISRTAALELSLRETAAGVLPRLLEEMVSCGREVVGHPGRAEALHEMRIEARPLRYVMEAFEPAFGKPFSKCLKELKGFLDVAGEVHDCDVMIGMLLRRIGAKRAAGGGSEAAADIMRDVKIARILAAQKAIRRKKFRRLQEKFAALARGKFRKKLVRSVE